MSRGLTSGLNAIDIFKSLVSAELACYCKTRSFHAAMDAAHINAVSIRLNPPAQSFPS